GTARRAPDEYSDEYSDECSSARKRLIDARLDPRAPTQSRLQRPHLGDTRIAHGLRLGTIPRLLVVLRDGLRAVRLRRRANLRPRRRRLATCTTGHGHE